MKIIIIFITKAEMKSVFKWHDVSLSLKMKLLNTFVLSVVTW